MGFLQRGRVCHQAVVAVAPCVSTPVYYSPCNTPGPYPSVPPCPGQTYSTITYVAPATAPVVLAAPGGDILERTGEHAASKAQSEALAERTPMTETLDVKLKVLDNARGEIREHSFRLSSSGKVVERDGVETKQYQVCFYADGKLYDVSGQLIGDFGIDTQYTKRLATDEVIGSFGTLHSERDGKMTHYSASTLELDGRSTIIINRPPPNTVRVYQEVKSRLLEDTKHGGLALASEMKTSYDVRWVAPEKASHYFKGASEYTREKISELFQAKSGGTEPQSIEIRKGVHVCRSKDGYYLRFHCRMPTTIMDPGHLNYAAGREVNDNKLKEPPPEPVKPTPPPSITPKANAEAEKPKPLSPVPPPSLNPGPVLEVEKPKPQRPAATVDPGPILKEPKPMPPKSDPVPEKAEPTPEKPAPKPPLSKEQSSFAEKPKLQGGNQGERFIEPPVHSELQKSVDEATPRLPIMPPVPVAPPMPKEVKAATPLDLPPLSLPEEPTSQIKKSEQPPVKSPDPIPLPPPPPIVTRVEPTTPPTPARYDWMNIYLKPPTAPDGKFVAIDKLPKEFNEREKQDIKNECEYAFERSDLKDMKMGVWYRRSQNFAHHLMLARVDEDTYAMDVLSGGLCSRHEQSTRNRGIRLYFRKNKETNGWETLVQYHNANGSFCTFSESSLKNEGQLFFRVAMARDSTNPLQAFSSEMEWGRRLPSPIFPRTTKNLPEFSPFDWSDGQFATPLGNLEMEALTDKVKKMAAALTYPEVKTKKLSGGQIDQVTVDFKINKEGRLVPREFVDKWVGDARVRVLIDRRYGIFIWTDYERNGFFTKENPGEWRSLGDCVRKDGSGNVVSPNTPSIAGGLNRLVFALEAYFEPYEAPKPKKK